MYYKSRNDENFKVTTYLNDNIVEIQHLSLLYIYLIMLKP